MSDPDASAPAAPGRPDEIAALARELRPLVRSDPDGLKTRLAGLSSRDQVELALRLPARDRLELLLHAPRPMALVRALPDFELYLAVREVGPADAEPLLALASAEQLEHLLDLESWRGDRFDADRCGAWAAVFLESGEPTLRRFLRRADDELLTLLFQRWIRVRPLEIDHEEPTRGHGITESGDERGFVSPDGSHLFAPTIPEHTPAARRLAELLYVENQDRYLGIVRSAQWEVGAELEERALHWRRSRLEEHGFVSRDEALEIYAPPGSGEVLAQGTIDVSGGTTPSRSLVVSPDGEPNALAAALDRMEAGPRERALLGITSLANRVLIAEGADTGDPTAHRAALRKATAFVTIALESRHVADPIAAADVLARVPPLELFREAHARLLAIQDRARALFGDGTWGKTVAGSLARVEAPIRGKLAGLLEPSPVYFESGPEGGRFRDFRNLAEVEEARLALDLVERVGRLLGAHLRAETAACDLARVGHEESPPRLSTLFLTAAAWHAVRGELRCSPLPPDAASAFVRLAEAEPRGAHRLVDAFVTACAAAFPLDEEDRRALELFGRASAGRLEAEAGRLLCLVIAN